MKFLYTADWQIGMKAAHVGAVGQRVRDERLTAARRVVHAAKNANADLILVAGDTEEPDYPISRDAAWRTGLDYLALGHWHSTVTYPASGGVVRIQERERDILAYLS